MVNVYIADVTSLPDPLECVELMQELSVTRIEKIKRQKQLKDRKQSLGAGLLLSKILKEYDICVNDIFFVENGKPDIEGICFNLSHSGDKVVCAVSEKPIGIDIEKIEEQKGNIAKRFFTDNENKYLNEYEGEDKKREFFRLWTMKESYMKYTGEGMKLALDKFEFNLNGDIFVYRDHQKINCNIKEYDVAGYKLTVCADEKEFAANLQEINLYMV